MPAAVRGAGADGDGHGMTAAAAEAGRGVSAAILLSVGAVVASAAHIAIDFAAGIYPPDATGSCLSVCPRSRCMWCGSWRWRGWVVAIRVC